VIIGRPLKEEGLSLQDARVFLSKIIRQAAKNQV
jgi:hypothetical protein